MPKRKSGQLVATRYPNAAVAYSTRLVNSAYIGPCLRVRRSSDNAEQDIGFAGGVLNEGTLLAFVGTDSAFVTTWYDQSGNARHATQATAANQPRIVNAGIVDKTNGRVSPFYTSATPQFFNTSIPASSNIYAVAAGNFDNDDAGNLRHGYIVAGNNNGSFEYGLQDAGLNQRADVNRSGQLDVLTSPLGTVPVGPGVLSAITSSTGTALYLNAKQIASTPTPVNAAAPSTYVGGATTETDFAKNLSEVVVYPSDQSANRAAIERNITQHFLGSDRLLNQYPNAAVAYSTRKLDKLYSGSAIRVRRSNDNAELDIGFDEAGNLNESALTTFVGANSAFVTTWYDQSGNGRNATQATAANQPRIVNAGVVDKRNGRVTPFFNGTNNFFSTAQIPFSGTKMYLGIVALNQQTPTAGVLWEHGANSALSPPGTLALAFRDTNSGDYSFIRNITGAGARTSQGKLTPRFSLFSCIFDNDGNGISQEAVPLENGFSDIYTNSSQTQDQSGNFSAQQVFIGSRNGTTSFYSGQMGEAVCYNIGQADNRTAIEKDIIDYFLGPDRLLNLVAGAALAYSTRLLDKRYTGAALRVRRSNDNAEMDIGFDANGDFNETALTTFVGANSAFVTTWYDQSGNGRHAVQTTAANQPLIVNAGILEKGNNRISVFSNTTSQFLRNSTFTVNQPDTGFVVVRNPDAGSVGDNAFDSAGSAANPHSIFFGNTTQTLINSGGEFSTTPNAGMRFVYGLFNGGNSQLKTNNGPLVTGSIGGNPLTGVTLIGNRLNQSGSNTKLFEVVIYASNQSIARVVIEQNIMSYFGITT